MLLGPTTVGKTDVAFGLARKLGAEVVNADKFYLYNALPNVTGQSDADQYRDVKSHLYGVLKIEEARWSEDRYSVELKARSRAIQSNGNQMIVEGCSHGLIRTVTDTLDCDAESIHAKPLLIGMRWKSGTNLTADCLRRANKMVEMGMIEEYQRALAGGLGESYVVRKCFARTPLLDRLEGRISISQCRNRVAEELERHARRHYRLLRRIPNVTWIENDRRCPEETIRRILQLRTAHLTSASNSNN